MKIARGSGKSKWLYYIPLGLQTESVKINYLLRIYFNSSDYEDTTLGYMWDSFGLLGLP